MKIEKINIDKLKPYANNAKIHTPEQIAQIMRSIEEFGNNDPIAVDENNVVIEGHGRLLALQQLGYKDVEVIRLSHMTDEQKRAYILVHNKLTMNTGFDLVKLNAELAQLDDIHLDAFDFHIDHPGFKCSSDWFDTHEIGASADTEGQSEEYKAFVEKFEPKLTTDDCYTPDYVYEVVADYVAHRYGLKREHFVRPFYPGGDYQSEKYDQSDVVVDNPPFSILSEIIKFYSAAGVKYFLFAPAPTLFSSASSEHCTCVCAGGQVVYENGADVNTGFVTNLEPGIRCRTAPDLYKALKEATEKYRAESTPELTKNEYPANVITSSMLNKLSKYGQEFSVCVENSVRIHALDEQREKGHAIFGYGFLVSDKAAADKAAADKAAADKAAADKAAAVFWKLSNRERQIIEELGGKK